MKKRKESLEISPDDVADFHESSDKLLRMVYSLKLNKFTSPVIGTTMLKVSALHAIRSGLPLDSFLDTAAYFYLQLKEKIKDDSLD